MEADGVNVAEMNKLLLQKVEELTLYMISMQKQQKVQLNKNALLEKAVITLVEKIEKLENDE